MLLNIDQPKTDITLSPEAVLYLKAYSQEYCEEIERTSPCFNCTKPTPDSELKRDEFYKAWVCPTCLVEINTSEAVRDQTPIFNSMCKTLELGWTLNQMVAVFKTETGVGEQIEALRQEMN